MLPDHPTGDYQYLPGISAFSCGTVARTGHEIVHVTLARPVPWRAGFARIERHLSEKIARGPGAIVFKLEILPSGPVVHQCNVL